MRLLLPIAVLCLCLAVPAAAARLFGSTALLVGVPDVPLNVVLADLDRDGLADLVTAVDPQGIGVARATGGGSFTPYTVSYTGHGAVLFAGVADFDGDGLLDVGGQSLGTSPDSTAAFVLYGDGNGGWQGSVELRIPGLQSFDVAQGDLDADGRPELVLGRADTTIVVVHANANRTLTLVGSCPSAGFESFGGAFGDAFGDVTGSSAPDLVLGSFTGVSIYAGNGDGTLGSRSDLDFGHHELSVALAPIDNVPGLDLVVAGPGVSWGSGLGGGGFAPLTTLSTTGLVINAAVARDFDGNGTIDIAAVHRGSSRGITVWPGDGTGGFGASVRSDLSIFDPSVMTFGDVDGDGKIDLASRGSFTSDAIVSLGRGDGGFGQKQSIATLSGRLFGLASGDFDDDGHLDAVSCEQDGQRLAFARGHGDGTFDPLVLGPTVPGMAYTRLVAGYFDGDTRLDLVGASNSTVEFLRGHGDGTFDLPVVYALPGAPRCLLSADYDGDGDQDVSVAIPTANAIEILVRGPSGLAAPVASPSIAGAVSVRYADVTGDGGIDRVVSRTEQWRVEVGDVVGGFSPLGAHAQSPTPGDLELADLDEDGRLDLVVAANAPSPAIVHIWHGQTGGSFNGDTTANLNWVLNPVANQESVAQLMAEDFDDDGHVDLVARSGSSASTAVVARGHGDRTFGAPEAYATPAGASGLVPDDFDEDGRTDLLAAGTTSSPTRASMTFLRNLSAGVVSAPPPAASGVALTITALAPNPSRGAFAFALHAPTHGEARISIHAANGREIDARTQAVAEGAQRVAFARGLAPGVYWVRVTLGGAHAASKFVVLP